MNPFAILFAVVLLSSAQLGAPPAALRSVADVEAFFRDQSTNAAPFRIRGVVQSVFPDMTNPSFAFQDESGNRLLVGLGSTMLKSGDDAILSGLASIGKGNEPAIVITNAQHMGKCAVDPPLTLALGDIDENRHHLRAITTTGTVIEVRHDEIDPTFRYLILKDGTSALPVFTHDSCAGLPDDKLLGATIRISGHYNRTLPTGRRYGGPFITLDQLEIITPPADPFDAPRLVTCFYQTPKELSLTGRRTVTGRVLASWNENWFLLRTSDDYLVGVNTSESESRPPFGATVTASGYPGTDLYHLFLTRALFRVDGLPETLPNEESTIRSLNDILLIRNGQRAFDHTVHGKTAALTGILRSVPAPESPERRAFVEVDGVLIPVDFSAAPNAFRDIEIGYKIQVTGCCILQVENRTPTYAYPPLKDFTLVLRQPSDIVIVTRTPWWTVSKLLVVIGILLAGLGALQLRNRILKRLGRLKVAERTRLAVELHDSLSQSLAGLACQIAAASDAVRDAPAAVEGKLATADRMLRSCRTELRQCLFDLRSDTLNDPDFGNAVRRTIEHLTPFADVTMRLNIPRARLDDSIAHAALSIIRELVTNAIRHATADSVRIAGTVDNDLLRFSVRDDGCGFDPSLCEGVANGHFGLNGIRERIKSLRGSFDLRSTPGKGTRAVITLPLSPV